MNPPIQDPQIETQQIYVRLLNEGTEVFRPTYAEMLEGPLYKVLSTRNYDPQYEQWEFVPGAVVRLGIRALEGEKVLIAVRPDCDMGKESLAAP